MIEEDKEDGDRRRLRKWTTPLGRIVTRRGHGKDNSWIARRAFRYQRTKLYRGERAWTFYVGIMVRTVWKRMGYTCRWQFRVECQPTNHYLCAYNWR